MVAKWPLDSVDDGTLLQQLRRHTLAFEATGVFHAVLLLSSTSDGVTVCGEALHAVFGPDGRTTLFDKQRGEFKWKVIEKFGIQRIHSIREYTPIADQGLICDICTGPGSNETDTIILNTHADLEKYGWFLVEQEERKLVELVLERIGWDPAVSDPMSKRWAQWAARKVFEIASKFSMLKTVSDNLPDNCSPEEEVYQRSTVEVEDKTGEDMDIKPSPHA